MLILSQLCILLNVIFFSSASVIVVYNINQKASPICIHFESFLTRYQFNNFNLGFDSSTRNIRFGLPVFFYLHFAIVRTVTKAKLFVQWKLAPNRYWHWFAHQTTTIVNWMVKRNVYICVFSVHFFLSSMRFFASSTKTKQRYTSVVHARCCCSLFTRLNC